MAIQSTDVVVLRYQLHELYKQLYGREKNKQYSLQVCSISPEGEVYTITTLTKAQAILFAHLSGMEERRYKLYFYRWHGKMYVYNFIPLN